MSTRQKYREILSAMAVSASAVGVLLLLGSKTPAQAALDPPQTQPRAMDEVRVSERLAAIRAAVSDVTGPAVVGSEKQLAWWAWRNGGGGWRNGGVWRNGGWRNGGWRNGGWGNGWPNFWRNW